MHDESEKYKETGDIKILNRRNLVINMNIHPSYSESRLKGELLYCICIDYQTNSQTQKAERNRSLIEGHE